MTALIEKYICELLYDHDCVVVPELGAFTAQALPAEVNPARHTFHPPTRQVAFQEKLKTNDDLLTEALARGEGLTTAEAQQQIRACVYEIRRQFKEKGAFTFEQLGTLSITSDYRLAFEAAPEANFDEESFGLPSLHVSPVVRQASLPPAEEPVAALPPARSRARAAWLWPLLLVSGLLLVAGLAYWLLAPATSPLALRETSVAPDAEPDMSFADDETPTEVPDPANDGATETPADEVPDLADEVPPVADESEPAPPVSRPDVRRPRVPVVEPGGPARYYAISGGFQQLRNAEKRRRELSAQQVSVKVLAPRRADDLYRISVADYATLDEARAALDSLKSRYGADVWVLKY